MTVMNLTERMSDILGGLKKYGRSIAFYAVSAAVLSGMVLLAGTFSAAQTDRVSDRPGFTGEAVNELGQNEQVDRALVEAIGKTRWKVLLSEHKNVTSASIEENYSRTIDLMRLERGKILRIISPLSDNNIQLAENIIMNYMVKSSAWPGVDIETLEECYMLRTTYSDGTSTDCYAYMLDGKAVMQMGTDGFYSYIDDELYEKLAKLVQDNT